MVTKDSSTCVLSLPVQALMDAVAGVVSQDRGVLLGSIVLADGAAVQEAAQHLSRVSLKLLGLVHAQKLYADEGASSTAGWVRQQDTEVDPRHVALARHLLAWPVVAEQVSQGAISQVGASALVNCLDKLVRHVDRPDRLLDG